MIAKNEVGGYGRSSLRISDPRVCPDGANLYRSVKEGKRFHIRISTSVVIVST
jgi:hypothetical protein